VQLIGSSTELRFDVSRLPRVDEFKGVMSASGDPNAVNIPSDVKTIVYYLQSEQTAASNGGKPVEVGADPSTTGFGRGLMRAELDRAVASYADSAGGNESAYAVAQLLAPEITGLGFEYYDGTSWLTEWDSATSGGLPRVIRIWLEVTPTYAFDEAGVAASANGSMAVDDKRQDFYFCVTLPTAPLVAAPAATEETTDTSEASTSGTSSTSSSGAATPAQGGAS
jgi:hypothetical protein